MKDNAGVSIPLQRRPAALTLPGLRHDVESLMGRLLAQAHDAEARSCSGSTHSRGHWSAVAAAKFADAELVAQVLGIGETAVA